MACPTLKIGNMQSCDPSRSSDTSLFLKNWRSALRNTLFQIAAKRRQLACPTLKTINRKSHTAFQTLSDRRTFRDMGTTDLPSSPMEFYYGALICMLMNINAVWYIAIVRRLLDNFRLGCGTYTIFRWGMEAVKWYSVNTGPAQKVPNVVIG